MFRDSVWKAIQKEKYEEHSAWFDFEDNDDGDHYDDNDPDDAVDDDGDAADEKKRKTGTSGLVSPPCSLHQAFLY